jgi:predicted dehydrogenase
MRVAVIGTGFGERMVAPIYRQLGCDTQVISPRDTDAITAACAGNVDLVSIHSPPFLHHDHVMLALDHGRNVLCDKPFGRNAQEAGAMTDRAIESGVLHFLNFEFRRLPARVKAKALLDAGAIGTLRHINWTYIGSGLRNQRFGWLFDKERAGGWIGTYGSHAIDAMRVFFADEVADCGGIMRTEITRRLDLEDIEHASTAEDAYSGWFVMANGGTVSMDTSFSTSVNLPHRIHLLGSEGVIEIVNDISVSVILPDGSRDDHNSSSGTGGQPKFGLAPWLGAVCAAVNSRIQIEPSFFDGLAVARTMDRLRAQMVSLRASTF